ncbi:replication restart helicase PriA [Hippea alviniae]|uniref:replication restart helicase PriA n=1 Tax=Hippea alviniae TaxID=1279027 RepID=UPI0003B605A3|nr:primosomal protein N' [Hippea alviniae]
MFYYYVLFPLAINGGFVYESKQEIELGRRVVVDFKSKKRIGIVWKESQKPEYETKEILSLLDDRAILNEEFIETLKFFSFYYLSYEGLLLRSSLPKRIFSTFEDIELKKESVEVSINPSAFELTEEQKKIVESISLNSFSVNLIFGVTGSGKTEVYLRLIDKVLESGKKAIVLVPEIALTPQYIEIFKERFDESLISVIHSRLTPRQRFLNWIEFNNSRKRILIGTRSAVFVNFSDVGIVVVDEENDESYKQESEPTYNAKDIAIYRAKKLNIPVVLSSATPSVESFYKAEEGKFRLFRLTKRVMELELPKVEFVKLEDKEMFSDYTIEAIKETLKENKTVAVLVNRRGFAEYMVCEDCGYVFLCPNCSVSLTYHKEDNSLRCHWCEARFDIPSVCPKCGSANLSIRGVGSEKVVEALKSIFPDKTIERFDRDSTSKKGEFERIITALREGRIDILVGTQMLSKGHDISKIGLVVVAELESLFVMPDFRATERALSLIIQTAGRSGRREAGQVIIQTVSDSPPFEEYIRNHDFESFLKSEIATRKAFLYPPFSRIIRIIAEKRKKDAAYELICDVKSKIEGKLNVVGPTRCPIFKLRNRYRYHLLIKSFSALKDISILREIIGFKDGIHFDVDPVNFF